MRSGRQTTTSGTKSRLPLTHGITTSKSGLLNDLVDEPEQADVQRLQPIHGGELSGKAKKTQLRERAAQYITSERTG